MIAGKSAVGIVGKQPEWFWKPFIPAGRVTLIQGNTGIGKTSLMLRIVADSTNGLKPPTQFHGELLEQPLEGADYSSSFINSIVRGGEWDEDPLFVNPDSNDFHLQEDSPAIGIGFQF